MLASMAREDIAPRRSAPSAKTPRKAKRKTKKKRGGPLRMLGDILEGAYPGRPDDKPLVRTFSWWDRTVPARIAKNARPFELRRGVLVIHTKGSAWAQELSFHEEDLLGRIQKRVPAVKRLHVRVGPLPPGPKEHAPRPPKIPPLRVSQLPSDVARALAHVGDDALRTALTRAVCAALAPDPAKRAKKK
jgi:hypothetical protein